GADPVPEVRAAQVAGVPAVLEKDVDDPAGEGAAQPGGQAPAGVRGVAVQKQDDNPLGPALAEEPLLPGGQVVAEQGDRLRADAPDVAGPLADDHEGVPAGPVEVVQERGLCQAAHGVVLGEGAALPEALPDEAGLPAHQPAAKGDREDDPVGGQPE